MINSTENIDNRQENKKKSLFKRLFPYLVYLVAIPVLVALGVLLFEDRKYNLISIAIAFLSCFPFFIHFERKNTGVREMVVIAVMTAISVVGRLIFAPLPFFKPITAVVIITALAFGGEAGFITGSLSAIVSNIYFGQGPWTPFQMLVWGLIGFVTGIATSKRRRVGPVFLTVAGFLGGVSFSFIMDIWTTVSMGGEFQLSRYLMYVITALPVTAVYVVSNVIFLFVLTKPILSKLNRVKTKFGLFPEKTPIVMTWRSKMSDEV